MNDIIGQRNIANARLLLEDAMPNGRFDVIRSLVTPDAPIRRAGFADLYTATGDAIPTVMLQFHMTAPHSGTFAGAPARANAWSGTRSACRTSTTRARSPTCGSCARS